MVIAIRTAIRDDLPALTDIYNHFVRSSHATFDTAEFTMESRTAWFDEHADSGPHQLIAAEADREVIAAEPGARATPRLSCGFTVVDTFTEAGHKNGRYVDVQWFEREVGT